LISSGETCIVWFSSVIKLPSEVPFVTSSNVRCASSKLLKLSRFDEFTENPPFCEPLEVLLIEFFSDVEWLVGEL
jgi:hypothetical protein